MRKKIGELLTESGAVNPEQVKKALGQQRAFGSGQRLGSVIITLGFASPSAVARALARQYDLPFVELPEISEQLRSIVSFDFQAEQRVVPFRLEREGRSERLHVAVDDPSDLTVVDEVSGAPVHVDEEAAGGRQEISDEPEALVEHLKIVARSLPAITEGHLTGLVAVRA